MGALNLLVFLFIAVPFFLSCFRIGKSPVFPVFPDRMDDNARLIDYCRDLFPVRRGLHFSFQLDLRWKNYRTLNLSCPNQEDAESSRFCRGVYSIASVKLVAEDRFTLFRREFSQESDQILTVCPAGTGQGAQAILKRYSPETKNTSRSLLKDSSFYESRLYYPGDDPRRINWNLQARFGNLFVRDGYTASPAGKKILVLLNGAGPLLRVDRLCRECRSLLEDLQNHQFDVSLLCSGMRSAKHLAEDSGPDEMDLLAAAAPVPLDGNNLDPAVSYGAVFLYSATAAVLDTLKGELFRSDKVLRFLIIPESERAVYRGWHVTDV